MSAPNSIEPARDRVLELAAPGDPIDPHDVTAEQALLGALLLKPALLDEIQIDPADHYQPAHETIHRAILAVHATGAPVDTITVNDHLRAHKQIRRIGGPAYLNECVAAAPGTANAEWHADIITRHATRRRLQTALDNARLHAGSTTPLHQIITQARDALDTLTNPTTAPAANTWTPVDLNAILDNPDAHAGPRPAIALRRDGQALLYPGAIHSISSEPGGGKTWFAILAAAQELENLNHVTFIDFEDRPATIVTRLLALDIPPETIRTNLHYIRPDTALDDTSWPLLAAAATGSTLAILDGITEAMTMHGLSLMDNEDAARFIALLPRRLADLGPAVLQIDHVVKNSDTRGRYAIGAQHKLAAIDGVAYKLLALRSFGKGEHGVAKLVIDKDRHGNVGPNGATVADLHLDATDTEGALRGWLDHPTQTVDDDGNFRPTVLMQRVSEYLERANGVTGNAIRAGVRGKTKSINDAIATLINEGHIRLEEGPRGASFHYLVTPFRNDRQEASDDTEQAPF